MSWVSGIQDRLTSCVGEAAASLDAPAIGQDVAMGQHHALRLAGRAGGELDEGHIIRGRACGLPGREMSSS